MPSQFCFPPTPPASESTSPWVLNEPRGGPLGVWWSGACYWSSASRCDYYSTRTMYGQEVTQIQVSVSTRIPHKLNPLVLPTINGAVDHRGFQSYNGLSL